MKNTTKKIALIGVLASLAIVLSYLETLLPPIAAGLPGIKMGLPNIIIIFALYRLGTKEAIAVSAVRIICVALLFGSIVTLAYSVAGAVLSLALMVALKRVELFSTVGVSISGGVCHNIGQIAVAALLMERAEIALYLPVLLVSGTVAGLIVGLAGHYLLHALKNSKL
jgi:heptaprenyl diphosphate synthase